MTESAVAQSSHAPAQHGRRKISVREMLVILWVGAFVINALSCFALQWGGWIEGDNFQALLAEVSKTYSIYLGVILAFVFGGAGKDRAAEGEGSRTSAWVAVAISILWNLLICVLILRIFAGVGRVEHTVKEISFAAATLSWFVAPAVGYYFARPSSR